MSTVAESLEYGHHSILLQRAYDNLLFPVRALFVPYTNTFGLTSLREERFNMVAKECRGRVLDVGCGEYSLFIKKYIGVENGIGIDVYAYEGVENIVEDLTNLPFENESFDTVTLVAVGGHIPKQYRVTEFMEFSRVLKYGGRLVMTEGERITQTIGHMWRHFSLKLIGKEDMDSERGMEEEEEYCMPSKEIMTYLNTKPLRFKKRIRFQWGLNNVYVAEKI